MKVRIEIDPGFDEEVIIRAPAITDEVKRIRDALTGASGRSEELAVKNGDTECYVAYGELLFFETSGDKVWAHTSGECFLCPLRLNELIKLLPRCFTRASKSCVINTAHIRSLTRTATGIATAAFNSTEKKVYISRMYYKTVREIIEETRLK